MASFAAKNLFDKVYGISNKFGDYDPVAYANYPGKRHPGTDYVAPNNARTKAVISGVVSEVFIRSNQTSGRGNEVRIRSGNVELRYCHLNGIYVEVGQKVKIGDVLGLVGWTGYVIPKSPAGAHLHIEMLVDGQYVDIETNLKGVSIVIEELRYLDMLFQDMMGRNSTEEEQANYLGKVTYPQLMDILRAQKAYENLVHWRDLGFRAEQDNWQVRLEKAEKNAPQKPVDISAETVAAILKDLDAARSRVVGLTK